MNISLTDVDTIKRLLGEVGAEPQRSRGQNFLTSEEVLEAALLALRDAPLRATELGAGLGVLTSRLAAANFEVRAIEKDEQLAAILQKVLPPALRTRVSLIVDDLRSQAWAWPEPYVLIGNIPYNLSGLIFRTLTQLEPAPERVVLLVQKEVSERVRATVPNMSLLALAVQLWGEVHHLVTVPPQCFWPQPQVSSELILLLPKANVLPVKEREAILDVARTFFVGKRKQMGGQLRKKYGLSASEAETRLQSVGLSSISRPQEVTVEQWISLAQKLEARN